MTLLRIARLAWRNLWRNRRRTALTLASICFGFFLAVLFTAMQDRSFADTIDVAARMGSGHVSLQHTEYLDRPTLSRTVPDADAMVALAEKDGRVAKAVPRITGPAMLNTARASFGAMVMGVDPTAETPATFTLDEALVTGKMFETSDERGIVLGERLAKNLGLEQGDKVVYTVMGKDGEIVAGVERLSGTLRTGTTGLDGGLALLPLDRLRATLGYDAAESTVVAVYLDDSRDSSAVEAALDERLADTGTDAVPWDVVMADLSSFIAMKVGGSRFMELVIMLLVAASIFNTLFMSVMERRSELGILLALGMRRSWVFGLVMMESLWLALVGVVAGALVTWGPYSYLAEHGIDMSAQFGDSMDVAGVGMSSLLQVGIFTDNLVIIVIAVVLATLLSGVYPAWQAMRIPPVEAVRLV
jgi:ABC-type lipoprotein release transport system permease subunit